MSSFEALYQYEPSLASRCPLYEENSISVFFMAGDFYPIILGWGLFAISIFQNDFYLFLFSASLGFNGFLNYILRVFIIAADNRFPDCGTLHQMPSLSTDHIVFFVVVMISFVFLWRYDATWVRIFMLSFFMVFSIVSRVYIGINTVPELVYGAFHGAFWAIVFQVFVYYAILPNMEFILTSKLAQILELQTVLIRRKWRRRQLGNGHQIRVT